jgi:hypothetical protein
MSSFNKEANAVINENIQFIKRTTRVFYPKGLKLSPELIAAYRKEVLQHTSKGECGKKASEKILKALRFHKPE